MPSRVEIGRTCPYCGAMVSYDEYFCRACHRRFENLGALDAPSSHRPEEYIVALPRIWVTAILSVIGVGLGQFYNGDLVRGILFFLGFLAVSFGYIVTPYHTFLYAGIWAAATLEALWSTWRISRCQRSYTGISYPLYVLLLLLGLVAALHVVTGEPDLMYMAKLFPSIGVWLM